MSSKWVSQKKQSEETEGKGCIEFLRTGIASVAVVMLEAQASAHG